MLIGYARVSTTDQTAESQILALQKAGCERVFTDTASGASADRPELRRLLNDVLRPGDTLVFWKLDRLGRSLKDLTDLLAQLNAQGVGVRSLTDPIDTTTPSGVFIFQLFGALAEFERALMLERTMSGLAAARSQGRVGGRPKKPLNSDLPSIRRLLDTNSLTIDEIAKLSDVSRSTLLRRLKAAPPSVEETRALALPKKRRKSSSQQRA